MTPDKLKDLKIAAHDQKDYKNVSSRELTISSNSQLIFQRLVRSTSNRWISTQSQFKIQYKRKKGILKKQHYFGYYYVLLRHAKILHLSIRLFSILLYLHQAHEELKRSQLTKTSWKGHQFITGKHRQTLMFTTTSNLKRELEYPEKSYTPQQNGLKPCVFLLWSSELPQWSRRRFSNVHVTNAAVGFD